MLVVAVETEPSLQVGSPQTLFVGQFVQETGASGGHNYDIAPDGQRFIMMETLAEAGAEPQVSQINVVLNWFNELTERVPVP